MYCGLLYEYPSGDEVGTEEIDTGAPTTKVPGPCDCTGPEGKAAPCPLIILFKVGAEVAAGDCQLRSWPEVLFAEGEPLPESPINAFRAAVPKFVSNAA